MVYTGAVAVATINVPVQLSSTDMPFETGRLKAIKASGSANSAIIYIGGPTVSATTGYPLAIGGEFPLETMETNAHNLLDIWIVGAATDGVVYFVSRR